MTPVLYSFRRCPYAMRARLAIAAANQKVELREVVLKHKPAELIAASSKATVPVLVLANRVIDESVDIMAWALQLRDAEGWLTPLCNSESPVAPAEGALQSTDSSLKNDRFVHTHTLSSHALIRANDHEFKPVLDKYKYFDRFPEHSQEDYLQQALPFLHRLNDSILAHGGHLASPKFSAVDAAVFPFIRQFAHADPKRFQELPLSALHAWLDACLNSSLFKAVMHKYPAWSAEQDNGVEFGKRASDVD